MIAAKYHDDQALDNDFFAEVGGIRCVEINLMEIEFLFLINFSLTVSENVYGRYRKELTNHAAFAQCCGGNKFIDYNRFY